MKYRNTSMRVVLLTGALFQMWGCDVIPELTGLDPISGPPGTVVEVSGNQLLFSTVRWDANTPNEVAVHTNFISSPFFTVPLASGVGPHPVRLHAGGGYSPSTINFTVTPGVIWPEPRVDDVTVSRFELDDVNTASMILMVHGANFNVGTQVVVDGVAQESYFWRVLRNPNMHAADPATLGYPIFHYATILVALENHPLDEVVDIAVENLDGLTSNTLTYNIPPSQDDLDSDGDGLLDSWEIDGYDPDADGVVDIDLPALGADPLKKDLFVEVDWMAAASPNAAIWPAVEDAFANAPILNSDGSQGIAIHIDRGQPGGGGGGGTIIPFADGIRYDDLTPVAGLSYVNLHTAKADPANFDPNRLNIFRYGIFAWDHGYTPGLSGRAEGPGGMPSNDFFVSLGNWIPDGGRADLQTGTFLHELGHTLGLRHGGDVGAKSKDNYNSVMQYGNSWIMWVGQFNKHSPSQWGGVDTDCDLLNVNAIYTYSQGMRADLDENDLDENAGVCDDVNRDWNGINGIENSVMQDLDGVVGLDVIGDYPDWANIELNFRVVGSDWGGN